LLSESATAFGDLMKNVSLIVAMVFVVAACNLSEKFKKSSTSNSNSPSSSSNPSKAGNDSVEQPNPTAAQTAAIANGQTVKWDEQGITWTLPANWKKQTVTNDMFNYGSGDGAFLIVSISSMASDFPTDISLKAFHEGAKVREKNGQVDELKWLQLDGVKGIQFRESKPQMADDIRRLQWMTYSKYAGQTQLVNVILSTSGSGKFEKHSDELYGILFSTKLVH
jgi:hypothetical protein